MRRTFAAGLLALALAACSTSVAQSPGAASATPSPSATPEATPTPTEVPTPEPTESAPPAQDPAAGLTLVQFPDPNSPTSQIFVVEADGSLRQVTGVSGDMGATRPAWSPDGTILAFEGPKTGSDVGGEIGMVDPDGGNERRVASGAGVRWSPDGTRILFSEVDDVTSEPVTLYLMDVASGEITDLGQAFEGRWIDDERIAFRRLVELDGGARTDALFTMTLDGGEPEQLAIETEGFWSPDGASVLLVNEGVISLANADGTSPREVVKGFAPVWSPDGSRFVFAYDFNQDALPILAVVDTDGDEVWSGMVGSTPTWSPDGTRIAVEIEFPEPMVQVLDAATGEVLYEIGGSDPAWMP